MPQERLGRSPDILGAPAENFSRGLLGVDLHPDFGPKIEGKVRDNWVVEHEGERKRIMVTTDRQSAYDRMICTVPDKGKTLNLSSKYWFESTWEIMPDHMLAAPHPNLLIARQAEPTLPIEFVYRRYMARSSTPTSIYANYFGNERQGLEPRRRIYGIDFPDGLIANQEFPMGTIFTPTNRGEVTGHDEELTDEEAREFVDGRVGRGIYDKAKEAGYKLYEYGLEQHKRRGLLMPDTKIEFGLDKEGNLMLIDELFTSDSSRLWLLETYPERFRDGENPDTFDKDILRRWLADNGFTGNGSVPVVDRKIKDEMALAYEIPYRMVTGKYLPDTPTDPLALEREIQQAVNRYYNK